MRRQAPVVAPAWLLDLPRRSRDDLARSEGLMIPVSTPEETLRRVRAEFLEMPGLKLTVPQAQRLWGVDRRTCEAVIDELTESRFLSRTRDGAVVLRAATVA